MFGGASGLAIVSGKFAGLSGRRKIDRAKSAATTPLIFSPASSPANGRHRDGHRFEVGARVDIDVARGMGGPAGKGGQAERKDRKSGAAGNETEDIHRAISWDNNDSSPRGVIDRRLAD